MINFRDEGADLQLALTGHGGSYTGNLAVGVQLAALTNRQRRRPPARAALGSLTRHWLARPGVIGAQDGQDGFRLVKLDDPARDCPLRVLDEPRC